MKNLLALSCALFILLIAGCSDAPSPITPSNQTSENSDGHFSKQEANRMADETNNIIPNAYIVVFSSKLPEYGSSTADDRLAIVAKKISDLRNQVRFEVTYRYETCLTGFAATMDAKTAELLKRDPRIESIEPDRMAYAYAQTLPTGINRIDADQSSTLAGNGSGTVTGVDVYIIDTGIQTNHPDLNVKGGANFSTGNSFNDGNGHGTHVAGTVAAKDNTSYVVAVAPGADLYAVRVLNNSGSGSYSQILAGVNWVTNRRIQTGRASVANMSLGGYTGSTSYNSLDNGIVNSINAGVTYCIAAGNSSGNAQYYSPAHVTQAITVGAYSASSNTWASFSNYGSIVDVLGPGVSVLSTYRNSSTATLSGTSMSTPHVAGAAAMYLSSNSAATPAQVGTALLNAATSPSPGPNPTITGVPGGTTNVSVYSGNF